MIIRVMKAFKTAKTLAVVLAASALAGCLTSASTPEIACWSIEYTGEMAGRGVEPRFGVARVSQIVVRAPYTVKGIAVLRANGTVAFDPYNEYAAGPNALLKGVVEDALAASGLFKGVVGATSAAGAAVSAEVTVARLALDCRREGLRNAVAELEIRLLAGRDIVSSSRGSGIADAADGNYGAAFSGAVTEAIKAALGRL